MKILILSWHFPPVNTIAAIRIGKMARFFERQGHEVRVVTARARRGNRSLNVEIPAEHVHETGWIDTDKIFHPVSHLKRRLAPAGPAGADGNGGHGAAETAPKRSLRRLLADFYNGLVFFPDRYVGWVPPLLAAGRRITADWRPDLIYASGPPFSTFIAAHLLSRQRGIPWVAEFRDRWVDDPYTPPPPWRHRLEAGLERRLVAGAAGLVTVSEPWAEFFRAKHAKPTVAVYNGYDPADFPVAPAETFAGDGRLSIVHTGYTYPGRRDPSPLFEAIALAGLGPDDVRVIFYGTYGELVLPQARRFGVADCVEAHRRIAYAESIGIQRRADVLLLLQWNNPLEQGNVPAKVFEYFAVMRPILGIGYEQGVPARLIRDRCAGLYSSDPEVIAGQLRQWVDHKKRHGALAALPESVRQGLSRDTQYEHLAGFLSDLLADPARQPTAVAAR